MQLISTSVIYENQNISIVNGDIDTLKNLDALVCPTNPYLMQEPGISGSIFKACGRDKLRKACQKILHKQENNLQQITTVQVTKSYDLKEKQNINNILMAVEPVNLGNEFNETLIIQVILNILLKSEEFKFQKIGTPILCINDEHYESKYWAIIYKRALAKFSEQTNYKLELFILCNDENSYYNFKKAFHAQEFVQVIDKYITELTDTDVMINPINSFDPKFGASGRIFEAGGYLMGQEVMNKAKNGKKWILTDSYNLKENRIKQVLHFIGPINKTMNRDDKLKYFFTKLLFICFADLKCQSFCLPLIALPQVLFTKNEIKGFLENRLSNSLKDAIEVFEANNKCGIIKISIQNNRMRQYCKDLFQ